MTNKITKLNKQWLLWLMWVEVTILLLLWFYFMGPTIFWNLVTVATLPDKCASKDISDLAKCTEITRNFGWMLWMLLSATGVGFGLWLTWQGRKIQQSQWIIQKKQWETQHKSHLQERFEKAADMLDSKTEWARIVACRSLVDLAKTDESMKSRCVRLLFEFVNNPYLETTDKGKNLDELFLAYKSLHSDIQSAIDSFTAIYDYYGEDGVDDEAVNLPPYFWQNTSKGHLSLIKANLADADLEKAFLFKANLRGAILTDAKFSEAILWETDLRGADLRRAELKSARFDRTNLQEAILRGTELEGVNLRGANLQRAELLMTYLQEADLQGANLRGAVLFLAKLQNTNLKDADISLAYMHEAKDLTKEQILSAKWGYDRNGKGRPPKLPEYLMQDKDVEKWLKEPTYDERERFQKNKSPKKSKEAKKSKGKAKKPKGSKKPNNPSQ